MPFGNNETSNTVLLSHVTALQRTINLFPKLNVFANNHFDFRNRLTSFLS